MDNVSLKPLKSINDHCFGCGEMNSFGIKMKFFMDEQGQKVISVFRLPSHLAGWINLAHGGAVGTVLDEIMSWTVIYRMKRILLTKSITIDFLKPVPVEQDFRAEGRISLIKSEREIEAEGFIYDSEDRLLARSRGIFALFSVDAARKLGFMNHALINEFEKIFSSDK